MSTFVRLGSLMPESESDRDHEIQRRPFAHAGMAASSSASNRSASVNLAETIGHAFSIMFCLRL